MICRLLLAVNVIFVVAFAWTVENCPEGVSRDKYLKVFGDKCYEFELFRMKTYEDALEYCEEDGGTLVLVKNETINDFITQTAKQLHYIHHIKIWMGLVYDSDSETYVWSDGSEMDYENFQTDPEYDESCIVVDTETGEWVEESCESYNRQRFVCEYTVSDTESKEDKFPTSISRSDCPLFYDDERIIQTFGDMCYVFFTVGRKTYDDANRFCNLFNNGSLVKVTSQEVNDFLEYHMYTTHRFHFESDPVWIGLRYDFEAEDYRWVDGTVPEYTNYEFDEHYQECVAMSSVNGEWQESPCGHKGDEADDGDKKYFICEVRPRNYHEHARSTPTTQGFESSTTTRQAPITTHVPSTMVVEQTTMPVTESKTTISVTGASTTSPRAPTTASSNPSASTGRIVTEKAKSTTETVSTISSTITTIAATESPATSATTPPKTTTTTTPPKTTTTTTPPKTTTTTIPPTTTSTTPSTTTSTTPPRTTTPTTLQTTTSTKPPTTTTSPPITTCESLICDLDCGMEGYKQDLVTGCMVCLCASD